MNKTQLKDLHIFFTLSTIGTAWSYFLIRKTPFMFGAFCVNIIGATITKERLNAYE